MTTEHVLSFDVGTKNLAVCDLLVHANGSFQVLDWSVNSVVPRGLNVNKTPVHELAPGFYKYVRAHVAAWTSVPDRPALTRIFIENQPLGGRGAARNLKTKVLSHVLQCVLGEAAPGVPITFVHPGLKLKDMPRPEDRKSTYRENKQFAITKTTEYVTSSRCLSLDLCKEHFLDKKMKKDDLADAFLQGLLAGALYARGDVLAPPEDGPKRAPKKAKTTEDGSEVAAAEDGPKPAEGKPAASKKRKRASVAEISQEPVVGSVVDVEAPASGADASSPTSDEASAKPAKKAKKTSKKDASA